MRGIWAFLCRLILMLGMGIFTIHAVLLCIRSPPVGILILAGWVWHRLKRWRASGWTFGTARLANVLDLLRSKLLGESGLILGRVGSVEPPTRGQAFRSLFHPLIPSSIACSLFLSVFFGRRWGSDRLIRLKERTHIAAFAPTGKGKGVSILTPNLLSYPDSCVVTDIGGQSFSLTAHHRATRLGHKCICLDPFGLCGPGSDSFNPLALIDSASDDFLDQCRDLANLLVVRTGTETDPHWNDAAELVICAFIAFVCACEPDPAARHLGVVREIVSSPHRYKQAIKTMQQMEGFSGVIQRLGELLNWFVDRELGSVLTTVQRHTQFLDSPAIASSVMHSTYDPRELKGGNRTIYLVLPHDRLASLAGVMRMWLGTHLKAITRGKANESRIVQFFIDEAGNLGHCRVLEDAVTLLRGGGVRLFFFYQSLGQLEVCYGNRARVFLDNFDTQIFFGTNSWESAESISKRIGECTVTNVSYSPNESRSRSSGSLSRDVQPGSISSGASYNYAEMARRVFKPEEILCLPEDLALIVHRNLPVIPARLLRYYDAPEFRNGRTGQARGFSPLAGVLALLVLAFSVGFSAIALMLPVVPLPNRPVMYGYDRYGRPVYVRPARIDRYGNPYPYGERSPYR